LVKVNTRDVKPSVIGSHQPCTSAMRILVLILLTQQNNEQTDRQTDVSIHWVLVRHPSSNSTPLHTYNYNTLDLPFGPHYTPAKFHVYISNGYNTIMLTRFFWLSRTNKCTNTCQILTTTYMVVHTTRHHYSTEPLCDLLMRIQRQTHTQRQTF